MKEIFSMPKQITINARSSSITNAFINGIIPCIEPSEEQITEVLEILEMKQSNICCAYCRKEHTEWDHFRPLVKDKMPTGYISEIYNLVPSCGKCNQSKGNKYWKDWILSAATLSPKSKGVQNLEMIIEILDRYESLTEEKVSKVDFEAVVGKDKWKKHWQNRDDLLSKMNEAQKLSHEIKKIIINYKL